MITFGTKRWMRGKVIQDYIYIYIAGGMEDSILDYFTNHYIFFLYKAIISTQLVNHKSVLI